MLVAVLVEVLSGGVLKLTTKFAGLPKSTSDMTAVELGEAAFPELREAELSVAAFETTAPLTESTKSEQLASDLQEKLP